MSTYQGSGEADHPCSPRPTGRSSQTTSPTSLGPIGTAAAAHLEGIDFAGKTGTADVVSGRSKGTARITSDHARTHGSSAWRPRRNPDIVVAVLVGTRILGQQLR